MSRSKDQPLAIVSTRWSRLAVLYASTIFLSAFLLFQVQPLISKFILPWFGGGPAVWTTCLLFFQTVLFAGYAYAHVSEHFLRPKSRTVIHLMLIGAALLTLPITPSDGWKPEDSGYPTGRILSLLAVCVGLPYFVLASTGPLIQAWFSRALPGRSPYRLYSLSNFGSLLALLSYPFLVEPFFDGTTQGWWWTAGFVLFCLLCGTASWQTAKLNRAEAGIANADISAQAPATSQTPLNWAHRLLWLALPAFASMLLMATTNHVCQDMPAVPFLWVVPLSLYLLSFIITFDHERWYRRVPYGLAALVAIYLAAGMSNPGVWAAGWLGCAYTWISGVVPNPESSWFGYEANVVCQFTGLFLLCMLCHGELVRLRPPPIYLTNFYLMISAGGALGGLSVSLIAPLVFNTFAEWKIGLVAGFVLAATVAFLLPEATGSALLEWRGPRRRRLNLRGAIWTGSFLVALLALEELVEVIQSDDQANFTVLKETRNFYGVLSVVKAYSPDPPLPFRMLYNGSIRHGTQFTDPAARRVPTTYYSQQSGVGQTLTYYLDESARTKHPLCIGAVGLGVGTLAAYVNVPGQAIRFYEINPEVLRLADTYFTYLADARDRGVKVEIVLGDARLSLQRELEQAPRAFDVLVLDAFSSDSIPIHLLTKEAFDIYLPQLAPGGALAVHISNRNLDLAPVVYGLAERFKLDAVQIYRTDSQHGGWMAEWIISSRNQELLKQLRATKGNVASEPPSPPLPMWTDQRHNLLEILK